MDMDIDVDVGSSIRRLSAGDAFRATVLNWWEMTTTLLSDASLEPVVFDATGFDVRIPANVELRRIDPSDREAADVLTPVPVGEAVKHVTVADVQNDTVAR